MLAVFAFVFDKWICICFWTVSITLHPPFITLNYVLFWNSKYICLSFIPFHLFSGNRVTYEYMHCEHHFSLCTPTHTIQFTLRLFCTVGLVIQNQLHVHERRRWPKLLIKINVTQSHLKCHDHYSHKIWRTSLSHIYPGILSSWIKHHGRYSISKVVITFYVAQYNSSSLIKALYSLLPGRTPSMFLLETPNVAVSARRLFLQHSHYCLQPGTHSYSWLNWGNVVWTNLPRFHTAAHDSNRVLLVESA